MKHPRMGAVFVGVLITTVLLLAYVSATLRTQVQQDCEANGGVLVFGVGSRLVCAQPQPEKPL